MTLSKQVLVLLLDFSQLNHGSISMISNQLSWMKCLNVLLHFEQYHCFIVERSIKALSTSSSLWIRVVQSESSKVCLSITVKTYQSFLLDVTISAHDMATLIESEELVFLVGETASAEILNLIGP
jgi:hypothetical protein